MKMKKTTIIISAVALSLISPKLHAAGRKKPNLMTAPPEATIISQLEYQRQLEEGHLIAITHSSSLNDPHPVNISTVEGLRLFKEDFESRLPSKKNLIKTDIPNDTQLTLQLTDGNTQPITLLGSTFAATTLAQNLQTRSSPFNESLIALQLARPAPSTPVTLPAISSPLLAPSCTRETGYKHGLDLGGAFTPSPLGLFSQLSWPLKPFLTCVKDQGKRGSCTAFATAAVIETTLAAAEHVWINLSEQAIYNQSKMLWSEDYTPSAPSTPNSQPEGYITSELLNHAKKTSYTFPLESEWEYNASSQMMVTYTPAGNSTLLVSHACDHYPGVCSNTVHQGQFVCASFGGTYHCGYLTGVPHSQKGIQVKDYVELWNQSDPNGSLDLLNLYLNASQPIIASIAVTNRLLSVQNGFADVADHNPDPNNPDLILGYHAVAIVGYASRAAILEKLPNAPLNSPAGPVDQPISGYFIIKNQWGTQWGDSGYVYVPGDYLVRNMLAAQALTEVNRVGF